MVKAENQKDSGYKLLAVYVACSFLCSYCMQEEVIGWLNIYFYLELDYIHYIYIELAEKVLVFIS